MEATRCWTNDPSQPITVNVGTQADVKNHAIETQAKIGWLHMLRGFVSIDWEYVTFAIVNTPNPSDEISTYLNQVRYVLKSRLSPDARRAAANAHLKTVIQALQDYYTLTI